ncbi:MAG: aromatic amino acid transport family protein [Patescibacteria group bacterium]|nr:hypothetical protein [Patescibacteria group bacterium]MBU2509654.1 hypothetical protein [Patescibacteria group bacterium]
MFKNRKTLVRGILAMIGTTIGAGIFGVPAMMEKSGILAGSIIFWIVAGVMLVTQLLFVEVIAHVKDRHRFPGYVGQIIGLWARRIGVVTLTAGLIGAIFAYIILGGEFLWLIASGLGFNTSLLVWQLLFWAFGSFIVTLALGKVAKIESRLTWVLIALIALMVALAIPKAQTQLFVIQHWSTSFAVLGVFVFALFGASVIPEVFDITRRRIDWTRRAVFVGSFVSALLTWLFGVFVYAAISNGPTTELSSMTLIFHSAFWWILPAVGFLAVVTSYIMSAFDLQIMYRFDLNQKKYVGLLIALVFPLLLLFIAPRNFIVTLETVGSFFTTTNALLIVVAAYLVMRREKKGKKKNFWWRNVAPTVAAALFVITIIQHAYELITH